MLTVIIEEKENDKKCLVCMTSQFTKKKFADFFVNANGDIYKKNLSYDQVIKIISDLQGAVDFYHKLRSK
jgi:hypothetical protein